MNLQQEYYLRNRVRAPFIFHGNGQILLRHSFYKRVPEKYKLVQIKSVNREQIGSDGAFIGRFDISTWKPLKSGSGLFSMLHEDTAYWNEYASFIVKTVDEWRQEGWLPLEKDSKALKLACWEMLSYSKDDNFATLPVTLLDLNHDIFDDRISVDTRCKLIDSLVEHMVLQAEMGVDQHAHRVIMSGWGFLLDMINSSNYSPWLADLWVKRD